MAANDEMSFEDAFNENTPDKQMQSDDEAFGLNLPAASAEGASGSSDAPAAVVIDIEPAGSSASAGGSENGDGAQANADAANAAANAGNSADDRGGSTPAVKEAGAGGEGSAAEEAAEPPSTEAAEARDGTEALEAATSGASAGADGSTTPDPYDMSDVPPEDTQQAKSWMGRLKKFEADLKAKAAALGQAPAATAADAIDAVADEPGATPDMQQAAEQVSDQVESGQMTPEQALQELAEDFGPDFIQKLQLAMGKMAGDAISEKLSPLEQKTQDIISHIQDGAEQAHFEQIFKAHPDFAQVAKDPAFQAFAEQQGKQDVVAEGSASAINQLISDFKDSQGGGENAAGAAEPPEAAAATPPVAQSGTSAGAGAPGVANDAVDEGELDAAEGVRGNSGGLALPKEPSANSDDFATAWDEF